MEKQAPFLRWMKKQNFNLGNDYQTPVNYIKKINGHKIDTSKPIFSQYPNHKKPLIEIKNLSKSFSKGKKKRVAINNLSFNIYQGENIALVGANGAGKTTTIEILAGINKPTSGEIKYNYPYKKTFQDEIGIQFQDSSYPPGISVWDTILFIIQVYNIKIKNEELEELLYAFGMASLVTKNAHSLSGGQQQRLNALLAVIHKPKIVFLDELSTGLDINIRNKIKIFIKDYAKKHRMTIVLISHSVDEIQYLANRIIILKNGEIKVDMKKSEIIKKYKSLEGFIQLYLE